jgi:hypothetical protein
MILAAQSMAPRNNLTKFKSRWSMALFVFGIALTLGWLVVLILLPLRMLHVV